MEKEGEGVDQRGREKMRKCITTYLWNEICEEKRVIFVSLRVTLKKNHLHCSLSQTRTHTHIHTRSLSLFSVGMEFAIFQVVLFETEKHKKKIKKNLSASLFLSYSKWVEHLLLLIERFFHQSPDCILDLDREDHRGRLESRRELYLFQVEVSNFTYTNA